MRVVLISFLFCVSIWSCNQAPPEELMDLTESWSQDSGSFWIVKDDSSIKQTEIKDTLIGGNYVIRQVFRKRVRDVLKTEKIILLDYQSRRKIYEADIYKKVLSPFTESRLTLSYDYESKLYSAYLYDSTGTEEKHRENTQKAKDAQKYAEENNLVLCGTAFLDMYHDGIPRSTIPEKISRDTALHIIDMWTKE